MKVIAVVNRRGGVGKTATAHALGAGLKLRGYKVLFVDLDSQGNLSYDTGATGAALSSLDVLTGRAPADAAITQTNQGAVMPAGPDLAAADIIITGTGKEYRLKEALEPLAPTFDYAIVDTPPALGTLTVNALTAAAGAIIPAQAEVHSIQGVALLNDAAQSVRKYCNPGLAIYGVLITRYAGRAVLSRDMRDNLATAAAQLQTRLFSTPIRECVAVKEAQASQLDIFAYAPHSNAAKDYAAFVDEFLQIEAGGHGQERRDP